MESFLQSFIHAFGWSIIHSLWQAGILYTLLLFSFHHFPKWTATVRHNLSYLSMCGVFVWFAATFWQQWTPVSPAATLFPATIPAAELSVVEYAGGYAFEKWFPLLILIYLIGIAVQFFIFYKSYRILRQLKSTWLSPVPAEWNQAFCRLIAKMNISSPVRFHLSARVPVPMVIGSLKPVILLPAALVTTLDIEQVEAILIHELTHIKRKDYLMNLIKTFMEIILFFNPFIWLIGRFVRTEREYICDEMVLTYTGQPVRYAETLLQLQANHSLTEAMALSNKKSHLLNRIKRITNMDTNYMNLKRQLSATIICVVALVSIAWLTPREEKQAAEETNSIQMIQPAQDTLPSDTVPQRNKSAEIKTVVPPPVVKQDQSVRDRADSLKKNASKLGEIYVEGHLIQRIQLEGKKLGDSIIIESTILSKLNDIESEKNSEWQKSNRVFGRVPKDQETRRKVFYRGDSIVILSAEMQRQMAPAYEKVVEGYKLERLNSTERADALRGKAESFPGKGRNILWLNGTERKIIADSATFRSVPGQKTQIFVRPGLNKEEKEFQESKEYQKLRKKFERDVEKLRKKQARQSAGNDGSK